MVEEFTPLPQSEIYVLGTTLFNALIAKQECIRDDVPEGIEVFEETIQRTRNELVEAGLDPDEIIEEKLRLLQEALQK